MGETSMWGYIALAAVILGFAYGLWRQKRRAQKQAQKEAERAAAQGALTQEAEAASAEAEAEFQETKE